MGSHKSPIRLGAVLAVFTLCSSAALAGNTYYVRKNGRDSADGLSPETALKTIQAAVNKCTDPGNTIIVAPGTYHEAVEIGSGHGAKAGSGRADALNRIVGDPTGAQTGEAPGDVTIHGQKKRNYGLLIADRDYWAVEQIRFRQHKAYDLYLSAGRGLVVSGCTVHHPTTYAMVAWNCPDSAIIGNTIERNHNSGYGIYAYAWDDTGGTIRVANNRFAMLGDDYLSTAFGEGGFGEKKDRKDKGKDKGKHKDEDNKHNGKHDDDDDDDDHGRSNGLSTYSYAIIAGAYGRSRPCAVVVENNVVTDAYMGIYAYAYGSGSRVVAAGNTVLGCYYGFYAYAAVGAEVTLADSLASDCYISLAGYEYRGQIVNSGMLEHNIRNTGYRLSGIRESNLVSGDPLLLDPAAGDYTPGDRSPALDAGTGAGGNSTDFVGNMRPRDGDGDGRSVHDLGAVEPGEGGLAGRRHKVVRWRETARVEE